MLFEKCINRKMSPRLLVFKNNFNTITFISENYFVLFANIFLLRPH